MTLSAALLENWVFGAFLCKFVNFTPTLTALVSTFTVAIIAVERWFFIVNKKKFNRSFTIITLVLLWLGSILIALPEFISRQILEFAPPPLTFPIMNTNITSSMINHNSDHYENNNTHLSMINMMLSRCHTKKIYFCVLNPGLRMRIFSYIVITLQYLVPFLFVSVSCYSISRFLKRRMKQMRVYQIHHSTNSNGNNNNNNIFKNNFYHSKKQKKTKGRHDNFHLDELTERELTSFEDIPETTVAEEKAQSNHLLTRIRNKSDNIKHHQISLILDEQKKSSAPIVNTIIMPNARAQSHSERRFHRSRKLLICVAALFTISWLPLTVVQIYLEHNEEITRNEPNFVYAFLLIPCYLISSLSAWMNPVIYNYINRSFRREFYALYPCFFKLKSSSSSLADHVAEITEMGSIRAKRTPIQARRDIQENSFVSPPLKSNKSVVRSIMFADGETKATPTLVIN